ncbi:MAG: hypothetical protein ACYDBL_08390 [Candidatus Acidiferrales bacterium]
MSGARFARRAPDLVSETYERCQVMFTRTGISFLIGTINSFGGSIWKSDTVVGIVPVISVSFP